MNDYSPLDPFFRPRSVTILGASPNPNSLGGQALRNLLRYGFRGQVFPVNPRYETIEGLPCYKDLSAISGPVDLAVFVVAAEHVLGSLRRCAERGVKGALILSAGFAETGAAGRSAQDQLRELARASGIRIWGPNSMGLLSIPDRTALGFGPVLSLDSFQPGPVSLVSQSGAIGFGAFSLLQEAGVGFRYVISTGNQVDLTFLDFIEFLIDEPGTRIILGYLEGCSEGRRLMALGARALRAGKTIILLKGGQSEKGQRAVMSHTAALAGSAEVFSAATQQAGILTADDVDDMLNLVLGLLDSPWPSGKRVGILTTSGGAGILLADQCLAAGLELPDLSPATVQQIAEVIPRFGTAQNPVDITAEVFSRPELFGRSLSILAGDPGLDIVLCAFCTVAGSQAVQAAEAIVSLAREVEKPILVSWTGAQALVGPGTAILRSAGVPVYHSPRDCARSAAALAGYGRRHRAVALSLAANPGTKPATSQGHEPVLAAAPPLAPQKLRGHVTERKAKLVLAEYGIPVTREELARSADEAVALARQIGYPVAMKIESPDLPHKTEAGGVRLGIETAAAARQAYQEILEGVGRLRPDAEIPGVLVQEMVTGGTEVMAGVRLDPQFGPTVVFGMGGVHVEVLRDVAMRIAPIDAAEAQEMIREIRGFPLLAGFRGRPPADLEALGQVLVRLSHMAAALQDQIGEMEINPLIVLPPGRGCKAVDALLVPCSHDDG